MVRTGLFSLLLLLSVSWFLQPLPANPPEEESALQNTLFLQQAMEQAKAFMHQGDCRKAVEVLEAQLGRVNGHPAFLRHLREAYRAYIKDLWLANQAALARRYLERLCILEPQAANDPTLRPPEPSQQKLAPVAEAPKQGPAKLFPNFALNNLKKNLDGKSASPLAKPSTVRAKADDPANEDDPFSLANMRLPAAAAEKSKLAGQYLSRAEEEFARRRFTEARTLYEQAYHADKTSLEKSRERWAYCMLNHVVEQLNRPGLGGESLPTLQQQVQSAVTLAPSLGDTGKWLVREIDQRHKNQVASAIPESKAEPTVLVQHRGRNSQGWQVAETRHFLIFHSQTTELAEKVARIAERSRVEMYRKWFGHDGSEWNPKCELILYANGQDYSRQTGVSAASPGHSRIESDPGNQRIIGRRMDLRCDNPGMLEAVLPHETTHIVLAGQFGNFPVPRWADEGIAVLTEPSHKIEQHRRNLLKGNQERQLFGVKELMELQDYPEPRRIGAFYAQSVCLVEFMTELRGPQVFTSFVRDGLREGYDAALRKHYSMGMADLQQRWQERLQSPTGPITAGR